MNWSEYIGNKIDRPMMSEEMRRRTSTMLLHVPFSHESLFDHDPNSTFISQLPSAYVNNSSLINLFNDLCVGYQEDMDFNDLPIPFACVATDMITGDEVVLRKGSVPTAMRASMAIPGVFSPVSWGDKVLVDGGLVNNFPADVLKEMGADIIIGVEVTSTKDVTAKDLQSLPQVFSRLLINSTSGKRVENRAMCNVHIIPDISGFGMLSFTPDAIDELVGRGYKRASDFHDQLLSIKRAVDSSAGHPVSKTLHAPHAKNLAKDSVFIRSIAIKNVSDRDSRWMIRKGGLKEGNRYEQNDIERAMKVYRGTGCFDEITYQVKESDSVRRNNELSEIYDLSINMKPAKPHVFGLGIRYDTEEGAALLLNVGLNEKKFNGSKFNATFKLSYNPKVSLVYTYAKSALANFSAAYHYRNEHFSALVENNKSINLHYQQHKVSGYISQFHLLNFSTNVGLSFSRTIYDYLSLEEITSIDSILRDNSMLVPFINLTYDNLDDSYFAKHGISTHLSSHFYYEVIEKRKYFDVNLAFQGYITPNNGRFTIIPQVYGRFSIIPDPMHSYFNLMNTYGSEIAGRHFENQMPFIGVGSIDANMSSITSILRCDLRYNFYGKHYLTAMYNIKTDWSDLSYSTFSQMLKFSLNGAGLKYSYNSFIGPISLTGHWLNYFGENHFGVYFSFGYTF
jgi:NTE family protein